MLKIWIADKEWHLLLMSYVQCLKNKSCSQNSEILKYYQRFSDKRLEMDELYDDSYTNTSCLGEAYDQETLLFINFWICGLATFITSCLGIIGNICSMMVGGKLRKSVLTQFLWWGPKILFLTPKTLDGLRTLNLSGVILWGF